MKIIEYTNREFEHEGEMYTVSSVEVADGHVVSLIGNGIEVTALAPTRGEGMLRLADFLKQLSYKLSMEAFIQEGAVVREERT